MSEAANKELIRKFWAAMSRGDVDAYVDTLSDDVRWKIQSTKFSTTLEGRAVIAPMARQIVQQLDGPYVLTVERMTAEDDRVAVEGNGRGRMKTGERYENQYCCVYRISGGRNVEVNEFSIPAQAAA